MKKTSKFAVFDSVSADTRRVEPKELFDAIFQDISTDSASNAAKRDVDSSYSSSSMKHSLTYGEVSALRSVESVLQSVFQHIDSFGAEDSCHFCDIGSGSGRVVVATSLLYPHWTCYGVELLSSLFDMSVCAQVKLEQSSSLSTVQFFQGSLLDLNVFDWTQCNIVFCNSTCFEHELMQEIGELARKMRPGTIFVSMSRILPKSAEFVVIDEIREPTSWGSADFFIQRKS